MNKLNRKISHARSRGVYVFKHDGDWLVWSEGWWVPSILNTKREAVAEAFDYLQRPKPKLEIKVW